jgi:8-oxo-dGTP pyrophosphatase MutT (NUDIX family)
LWPAVARHASAVLTLQSYPFTERLRDEVARRCALFSRLSASATAVELKPAAVAMVLTRADDGSDEASLLLTRRTQSLRAHGGQWALPGGRYEPGETAVDAALRELSEELALRIDASSVLGILDDYPTRSGYLITPIVAWAGLDPVLHLNANEVASVHRVTLKDVMRPDAVDFIAIPESDRRVIRLHVNGTSIHAPTAALVYQFRELLAGRTTRVFDLEQPVFAWR